MQHIKILEFYLFGLLLCLTNCAYTPNAIDEQLGRISQQVWYAPQTTLSILDSVRSCNKQEEYELYCEAMRAYSLFRQKPHKVSYDLQATAAKLEDMNCTLFAGQVYCALGNINEWEGYTYTAMQNLKKAESLLLTTNVPNEWLGVIYYKLGALSEEEMLNEVALDYYHNALHYLSQTELTLFLACVHRDIGRLSMCDSTREKHFNQAISYANALHDNSFVYELRLLQLEYSKYYDETDKIALYSALVNECRQFRYANRLVDWHIAHGHLDSAQIYLNHFAQDTLMFSWSKHRYSYLQSKLLLSLGKEQEAYAMLNDLYMREREELEKTGKTRAYAISKRYDLVLEQERNLKLIIAQQRSYLLIGVLLIGVLLLLVGFLIENSRRKASQHQVKSLNNELLLRRDSLRRVLLQKVELTQKMRWYRMKNNATNQLPEWINQFLSINLLENEEDFQTEFNQLYGNVLTVLKDSYPSLTQMDLLIISLHAVGLSISDICILLNLTKRTIWSRRLRIKKHLGLSNDDDLDSWIEQHLIIAIDK